MTKATEAVEPDVLGSPVLVFGHFSEQITMRLEVDYIRSARLDKHDENFHTGGLIVDFLSK